MGTSSTIELRREIIQLQYKIISLNEEKLELKRQIASSRYRVKKAPILKIMKGGKK